MVSPVFQGETCELSTVVDPLEFQGPAALRHAGQDQAVPLQVNLGLRRLHLEIRWDIIYWKEREKKIGLSIVPKIFHVATYTWT